MNMLEAKGAESGIALFNGITLPIRRPGLSPGQPVTVGIRPDDLSPGETPLLTGRITVQEPLGAETLIYVDVAGTEIVAKASGRTPPPVGSEVALAASPETVHVFDGASGEAIP